MRLKQSNLKEIITRDGNTASNGVHIHVHAVTTRPEKRGARCVYNGRRARGVAIVTHAGGGGATVIGVKRDVEERKKSAGTGRERGRGGVKAESQ